MTEITLILVPNIFHHVKMCQYEQKNLFLADRKKFDVIDFILLLITFFTSLNFRRWGADALFWQNQLICIHQIISASIEYMKNKKSIFLFLKYRQMCCVYLRFVLFHFIIHFFRISSYASIQHVNAFLLNFKFRRY